MTVKIFSLSNSIEKSERNDALERFLNSIFDEGGSPYFVPENASLYDITCGSEKKVIQRIKIAYGVSIVEDCFHWRICELLDFISSEEKGYQY